jgi:membrane dipeptidase
MNRHGIIIDVAHAGDRTALETIEASDKPILVSHRGTRTLTNTTRMLPDDILQALAEKDGVIAVEVAGFGLRTEKHTKASIEGLLEHIEYLINFLGVDYVGAGPDTMYQDHAGMYRAPSRARGHYPRTHPKGPVIRHATWRVDVVRDLDYVKGLESASDFANIARGLIRDGYSDQDIAKVMGLNGLRLIKACWPR